MESLSTSRSTWRGNCKANAATIHPPNEWPTRDARVIPSARRKGFEHFDENRDVVVDEWLIGAAEAQQVKRDDAMRGAEPCETEGPHIGIRAQAVNQYQRRSLTDVVVTDLPAK